MDTPLVSILIPVYNGSNYLREAIDSALAQTYPNTEILVINDGSRDEGATEAIARSYGDRIRYFSKENGGVSSALNVGIRNMTGEYFSWLSHDDLYLPRKVELQVEALRAYGGEDGRSVVLCGSRNIDKDRNLLKSFSGEKQLQIGKNPWHAALKELLRLGSYNGCALLIPKEAFVESGLFDEGLRYSQDALMWTKIFLNRFDLIRVEEVGVYNRIHGGQLTQKGRAMFRSDSERVAEEIVPQLADQGEHSAELLFRYARYHAMWQNDGVVKRCLRESKERRLLTVSQRQRIRWTGAYGRVRPMIRKVFYRVFRKIKTT